MPARNIDTLAFITADTENPLKEAPGRQVIFRAIFSEFPIPEGPLLVAGSGKGSDILALSNITPAPIVALDCNVDLDPSVRQHAPNVQEEQILLHQFLAQNTTGFAVIILSTGKSHGITEPPEYAALKRSILPGGIIICSWDSNLDVTQMQPEFIFHQIDLPYYPIVYTQQ